MITFVIPVYNEEKVMLQNILKLSDFLKKNKHEYEIIIAEDGSTDNSLEIAKKIESENKKIRVISTKERLGRGASIAKAIGLSKGEIVFYMDADLASDLRHVNEVIDEIKKGADIVTGSRLKKDARIANRTLGREIASRGYNYLIKILFSSKIHDHQCGFKAFRKSRIEPLLKNIKDKHWFWDTELLIHAQKKKLNVKEVAIVWLDRKGSSVRLKTDILYMGSSAIKLWLGRTD
ncbi:MAG: dolichyl-phosphate beta-glucosyltransferase [Candidatus Bilamarchaeum sp.]